MRTARIILALWLVLPVLFFSACGSSDSPSPTGPEPDPGPRFVFNWSGLGAIDSTYIVQAFVDVQDSVNTWFAPAAADTIAVQVSVDDLNLAQLIERGKGAATNNYHRALLGGVIAEGGEGGLNVQDGNPIILGAEIIIDRQQMAHEADRNVWKWVLLHETIHVMGFGTSRRWYDLRVATGDSLQLPSGTYALDSTGHWEQTGSGRLLEPYFPGADAAFIADETKEALEAIGWSRR